MLGNVDTKPDEVDALICGLDMPARWEVLVVSVLLVEVALLHIRRHEGGFVLLLFPVQALLLGLEEDLYLGQEEHLPSWFRKSSSA